MTRLVHLESQRERTHHRRSVALDDALLSCLARARDEQQIAAPIGRHLKLERLSQLSSTVAKQRTIEQHKKQEKQKQVLHIT